MKRWIVLLVILASYAYATPFSENGQLHVCGNQMCNENNHPIMLRGVSTHGIQWMGGWGTTGEACLNDGSMDALAYEWNADILRIAVYPDNGGLAYNVDYFTNMVDTMIEAATDRGMYVLVDWHMGMHEGGTDPNNWFNFNGQDYVTPFFEHVATEYGDQGNIIYGLCNEPQDVPWSTIKTYSDRLIPSIRAIDPDGLILAGTPDWSSFGISGGRDVNDILNNLLEYDNIIYDFHLYVASFGARGSNFYNQIDYISDQVPVWCAESASFDPGFSMPPDFEGHDEWHEMFNEKKISWMHWTYSDLNGLYDSGTCPNGPWDNSHYTDQGDYIWQKMNNPPDDWGSTTACTGYCCPTGNTCSNPIAGSCTTGTCCADVYDCSGTTQSCIGQGYYCCPYVCSQPVSGSGCASGNTCCTSQTACSQQQVSGDTRIAKWRGDKEAAFSIHFDDSMDSQANNALPVLIERGIPGTWYINPSNNGYQNNQAVWEDSVNHGQELADHTMTHEGANSYTEADYEIGECARVIWDINPDNVSRLLSFCWPGATSWDITQQERNQLLEQYNLIHRDNMDFPPDYSSYTVMNQRADAALASGEWGGICFHGIGGEWLAMHTEDFVEFADYLVTLKDRMWFGGNIAVHKYIEERDTANLQILEATGAQIRISLTTSMDPTLYDYPLTLITEVPWSEVEISHDGRTWTQSASNGELMYNVRPDRGEIVLAPVGGGTQPFCGDGTCDAGEDCNSCPADCGQCVGDCGNSICDADESCQTCAIDCMQLHPADKNPCNGVISTGELSEYIGLWKDGSVSMGNLMTAINLWKT